MATFYNQATLTFQDTTVSSNIVTGEIYQPLSVTKTAVNDEYGLGTTVTYAISIVNTGETSYRRLTLTDDLGAYELQNGNIVVPLDYVEGSVLYYRDGILQEAPDVSDTSPLTIRDISVPANGNAMIIYQATVNEYAPMEADGTVENTVVISGCRLTDDIEASETISSQNEPIVTITKTLTPIVVNENGRLTYTFVMENRGNVPAAGDTVLTDVFDPVLSDLAVTYNDETWTEGVNYNYGENSGTFTTVAGQITVPAAEMTQNPDTGIWTVVPGTATLTVTGTI